MSSSDQGNKMNNLFGNVMKEALGPSNIQVSSVRIDIAIPPDADVIICRRDDKNLSSVMRDMLQADGLRDNKSPHVMILFHNEGKLDDAVIIRTFAYANVCRFQHEPELESYDLHGVLVVCDNSNIEILRRHIFEKGSENGVYYTSNKPFLSDSITVIVLDELNAEPHNELLKNLVADRQNKSNS